MVAWKCHMACEAPFGVEAASRRLSHRPCFHPAIFFRLSTHVGEGEGSGAISEIEERRKGFPFAKKSGGTPLPHRTRLPLVLGMPTSAKLRLNVMST
jgi:hypothetical protein